MELLMGKIRLHYESTFTNERNFKNGNTAH